MASVDEAAQQMDDLQLLDTFSRWTNMLSPRLAQASASGTDGFGDKGIGFWGGFSLLWNNITGPGMVTLILIYSKCGWLPATVLLVMFGVFSGLSAGFLCDAMTAIDGNARFERRVEMMYLAEKLLHRYTYWACLACFIFNLMITNSESITLLHVFLCWLSLVPC